jgi:hypothetical protein
LSAVKQISVEQEDHTYLSEPIGTDAENVDIDETHNLAEKALEWDNKVDKINGKGLSTNDFTNNDKLKLDSLSNYDDTLINSRVTDIENVIPDNATETNKIATLEDIPNPYDDTLLNNKITGVSDRVTDIENIIPDNATETNKVATLEDIPELPIASENTLGMIRVGANLVIDEDGVLSSTGGGGGTGGTSNYSELINKPKINDIVLNGNKTLTELGIQSSEEGKGLSTNDYTNEEKEKLENIEENAEKNTIESISFNGVNQTIDENKNVDFILNIITSSKIDELWDSTFEDGDMEEY